MSSYHYQRASLLKFGSPEAAVANISVISQGGSTAPYPPLLPPTDPPATYIQPLQSPGRGEEKGVPVPMGLWNAPLMPPPMRPLVITARRNSAHLIVPEPVEVTLDDVKLKCESSEPNLYLRMIHDIPRIMIPPKPVFPGESTNLLTTVEGGRVPVGLPVQDNLGVIVNAAMIQTKAEPKDEASNMLPSMTERLDAFVNSAAESHISPTPTPAITENVLNHVTEMGLESTKMKMQESSLLLAPTLPVSHTSPGMDNGPICAMMDPPVSDQAQTQAVLECFNENVNSGELMPSPQLVTGNPPVFPDIHTLMGKQMPTLTVTCAPVNGPDMNGMIQSENQVQALSDIRDSLEQHLSPPVLSSGQMHPPQLNGLMQTSPHPQFQDLQTTIGQQMTAQSLNSSHTDINGMLRAQETPVEQAHLLNDIRVDLEQKFSPPINPNRINADLNLMTSPQIANHEQCLGNIQSTLAPQNLSAVSINHSELNDLIVSSSNVKTEVQDLTNMPTSFKQHLTNQMVQPTNLSLSDLASGLSGCGQQPAAVHMQALEHHLTEPVPTGHETLNNGITLDTLNASPQMQVTVSQAHALSTLQAINDHISSQVITSPVATNQSQPLPDLQLSLGHLTSDPSEEVGQEHNLAVVSQSQMLSNLQASIDEHLEAQSTCAEAMLCTTAAVQMNTQQAPGQLSPIRHLSPQQTILPDPISLSSDSSASVILSPTNARHASPPEINPAPMMSQPLLPATDVGNGGDKQLSTEVKKGEPMPNITHLAQMSENDLISYINTSCFDSV